MLLVQGARDTVVDPRNTDMLEAAIRAAGGRVETVRYSKQGHASVALSLAWGFRWLAPTLDDTAAFFVRHGAFDHRGDAEARREVSVNVGTAGAE